MSDPYSIQVTSETFETDVLKKSQETLFLWIFMPSGAVLAKV